MIIMHYINVLVTYLLTHMVVQIVVCLPEMHHCSLLSCSLQDGKNLTELQTQILLTPAKCSATKNDEYSHTFSEDLAQQEAVGQHQICPVTMTGTRTEIVFEVSAMAET